MPAAMGPVDRAGCMRCVRLPSAPAPSPAPGRYPLRESPPVPPCPLPSTMPVLATGHSLGCPTAPTQPPIRRPPQQTPSGASSPPSRHRSGAHHTRFLPVHHCPFPGPTFPLRSCPGLSQALTAFGLLRSASPVLTAVGPPCVLFPLACPPFPTPHGPHSACGARPPSGSCRWGPASLHRLRPTPDGCPWPAARQ